METTKHFNRRQALASATAVFTTSLFTGRVKGATLLMPVTTDRTHPIELGEALRQGVTALFNVRARKGVK